MVDQPTNVTADSSAAEASLAERVRAIDWYHTIDLGDGLVTPGFFDTRAGATKVPVPLDLSGKRCLDVGTWDGFWAFEMERRGAESVTAIDIDDPAAWDWPPHGRPGIEYLKEFKSGARAFALAKEALGSSVERIDLSVYDLDPERHGRFDFVFLGSLLLHLRDPVRALERLRGVCAGEAVVTDTVDALMTLRSRRPLARLEGQGRPWWWIPNVAGLRRMATAAGFEILESPPMYFLPIGVAHPRKPPWRHNLLRARGREEAIVQYKGIPHAAMRLRPTAPE